MKRVMILVFPTLWSPKNTSLYFANGAKEAAAGRACPDTDTTEERDITEDEEDVATVGREVGLASAVLLRLILVLPLANTVVLVAPVGA
jgi:hypothetical protein